MERKIGEIFEYNGEWYQCVESQDGSCKHCDMNFEGKCPIPIKECTESGRSDKSYVIFKKLEKVGEPYEHYEKFYQCYKLPMETEIRLLPNNCYPIGKGNLVEIEIKQNKEDMKEKKAKADEIMDKYYHTVITYQQFEKEIQALYADKEEIKPTLKPFDLEAAKAGKPVCTRDGRKVRIICFDRKDIKPIVALVTFINGTSVTEKAFYYFEDGCHLSKNDNNIYDLMMLPEKKEGWVNVYKGGLLDTKSYPTKKEAFDKACPEGYIDTIKISWEE